MHEAQYSLKRFKKVHKVGLRGAIEVQKDALKVLSELVVLVLFLERMR